MEAAGRAAGAEAGWAEAGLEAEAGCAGAAEGAAEAAVAGRGAPAFGAAGRTEGLHLWVGSGAMGHRLLSVAGSHCTLQVHGGAVLWLLYGCCTATCGKGFKGLGTRG